MNLIRQHFQGHGIVVVFSNPEQYKYETRNWNLMFISNISAHHQNRKRNSLKITNTSFERKISFFFFFVLFVPTLFFPLVQQEEKHHVCLISSSYYYYIFFLIKSKSSFFFFLIRFKTHEQTHKIKAIL